MKVSERELTSDNTHSSEGRARAQRNCLETKWFHIFTHSTNIQLQIFVLFQIFTSYDLSQLYGSISPKTSSAESKAVTYN